MLLASKTERESARNREHGNESGKQNANQILRDLELHQSGHEAEDQNGPACNAGKELRRLKLRGFDGCLNRIARKVADQNTNEQDNDGDDHVWQIQHDLGQEPCDLVPSQNVGRGHQEDDDEEPLHDPTKNRADVQLQTHALKGLLDVELFRKTIQLEEVADTDDESLQDHGDDEPDQKDDERPKEPWEKDDERSPQVCKGRLDDNDCVWHMDKISESKATTLLPFAISVYSISWVS